MKTATLAFLVLAFSTQAFSGTSSVYCKSYGRILNLMSNDGWECRSNLLAGQDVCFVGKRAEVINMLNSKKVRNLFDGTDGEFITNATYWGNNSIGYVAVDSANGFSEKIKLDACGPQFFRNR